MSDYKQTRDAAGKVTSQYSQMLQNLNDDDLVKRLRETTHMYQADCELKMKCADRIEQLAATCEELEAKLDDKEAECRHLRGQVGLLEAKLAKALETLEYYNVAGYEGKEARTTLAELKGQSDE